MLDIAPEIAKAKRTGRPVVALESTIISHGMPFPQNAETALAVEAVVRDAGAIPATVAVIAGQIRVGLSAEEIRVLGELGDSARKCSRRDLPLVVSRGETGATTVAATMLIADRAGIPVFATGGIGGVHRGVEATMDISADLEELGQSRVTVVCAGVKSVLDIGRTLEYLETRGVPVVGFGTDFMPAFYARNSGLPLDYRVESAAEVAAAIEAQQTLSFGGGMLVAVPIPETHAMQREEIDAVIDEALVEMHRRRISGKDTTPFLLARIAETTGGRSLEANIALVKNNARVAADIARELACRN